MHNLWACSSSDLQNWIWGGKLFTHIASWSGTILIFSKINFVKVKFLPFLLKKVGFTKLFCGEKEFFVFPHYVELLSRNFCQRFRNFRTIMAEYENKEIFSVKTIPSKSSVNSKGRQKWTRKHELFVLPVPQLQYTVW